MRIVTDGKASKSTLHYRKNAKSRAKKLAYDKEYQKSSDRVAYQVEHKRKRRQLGVDGKMKKMGKDLVRGKDGKLRIGDAIANRKSANRKR